LSAAFSAADHQHMARALTLAELGACTTHPNPRVGCVLVKDGRVVGEGWHRRAGGRHAEVVALAQAGEAAGGSTAYVTLEPCAHHGRTPPCSQALIDAGVTRVVVALSDPYPRVDGQGLRQLVEAGIEVVTGLMADQASQLNAGFLKRVGQGRPWVRVKLATSLDGRTALASGESRWISSDASRADVQKWRARSSAILTGSGTVLADDPRLNVRLDELDVQPVRVILDSRFRTPRRAQLFQQPGPVWLIGHAAYPVPAWIDAFDATAMQFTGADGLPDLVQVMNWLAEQEINEIQVEAGPRLCGALMAAGLVDEVLVYLAPQLLGSGSRGSFDLPGLESMADRVNLEWVDSRRIGPDLRLRLRPTPA
jgi:diaminohydroxyphosphoribosylaminopyrimidine deaminase/5-amino-6-(5-phosphoribosylamino)uracil reductase